MTEYHGAQYGTFHVTTNTDEKVPWCTIPGIPDRLIENLCLAKNIHDAEIYAFCILSNHMHILMSPGPKGLSSFMQSFKSNSAKDVKFHLVQNKSVQKEHRLTIRWQHGFYDEKIRTARQRSMCLNYIRCNAINHGLVREPHHWPWSSLHFEHLLDPLYEWID